DAVAALRGLVAGEGDDVLAALLKQVLPEPLLDRRAAALSHQGPPEPAPLVHVLQERPRETEGAALAPAAGCELPEPAVSGGPADEHLLQVGEVGVERGAAHAGTLHDIANRDSVVAPLQDQGDEGLVEQPACPLHPPVVHVRSLDPHRALFLEKWAALSGVAPTPLAFRCHREMMDIMSNTEQPVHGIELRHVTKTYPVAGGDFRALDRVELQFPRGGRASPSSASRGAGRRRCSTSS